MAEDSDAASSLAESRQVSGWRDETDTIEDDTDTEGMKVHKSDDGVCHRYHQCRCPCLGQSPDTEVTSGLTRTMQIISVRQRRGN